MNFLSLFSGIGGLDLGLERAGMKCVAQVEIDPFCRKVLAKHWPDVPRFEDVRTITAKDFNGQRIDLIGGGFPCQDVSTAGVMRGFAEGTRSSLYREVLRIAGEIRPRFIILENVAGLFVDGRIGIVLGDLAKIGFDAEWDCIPASAIGVHHIRDRVFILAYSERIRWKEDLRGREPGIMGSTQNATFAERPTKAIKIAGSSESLPIWPDSEMPGRNDKSDCERRPERPVLTSQWMDEPAMGRVADGVPGWLDRYRALGNAIVPQVGEWIGRRIMEAIAEQLGNP